MTTKLLLIVAAVQLSAVAELARASEGDCDITAFDKTDALLNPEPNPVPFNWGSEVKEIQGAKGIKFWNYVTNRADSASFWIRWDDAGIIGSKRAPLQPGKSMCNTFNVYLQPGEENIDLKSLYKIKNDATIVYGGQSTPQVAPVYVTEKGMDKENLLLGF